MQNNEIWLGSRSKGVLQYQIFSGRYETGFAGNSVNSLKKNFILSIFEDHNNDVWIGQSGGGLAKFSSRLNTFEKIRAPNGDSDRMILCINNVEDHFLYMGTLIGGLLEYNLINKSYKYYFNPRLPVESRNIYDIKEYKNRLWLATWAGLCSFDKKTKKIELHANNNDTKSQKLYALNINENQENIMVSGEYGTMCFDINKNKWQNCQQKLKRFTLEDLTARSIQYLSKHVVGFATTSKNFVTYDLVSNQMEEFSALQHISVSARHFFKDSSTWWIATDKGLIEFDFNKKQIIKLWDKKTGLSDDFIYAVLKDEENNIWVSHNKGLSMISLMNFNIKNYTPADGLQDYEFNTGSCFKSKNGIFYFGGINGVNSVDIKKLNHTNEVRKPIITQFKVMNREHSANVFAEYKDHVTLESTQNFISFDFVVPNPANAQNINYQYKLTGVDEGRVDAGKRPFANYTQLKPGEYVFNIRSYDNGHNISESSSPFNILIKKPFWLETWFVTLIILSLLLLSGFALSDRITKLNQKFENELQMANLEQEALYSQMNSHFIFNSINTILQMIIYNENESARKYLSKFATILRARIENSKSSLVQLHSELDLLTKYLEIEKLRIKDFTFSIEKDHNIDVNITLPSFILQPLIENIVWYKLAGVSGTKALKIILIKEDNTVYCDIYDNSNEIKFDNDTNLLHIKNISMIMKRIRLINKKFKKQYSLEVLNMTDNTNFMRFTFT